MHKIYSALLAFISLAATAQDKPYFQQTTDYEIHVRLNDSLHRLNGLIKIDYTNNSPDTLHHIYMHLWPDAYKNTNTALGNQLLNQGNTDLYLAEDHEKGWIDGVSFRVNGHPVHTTPDTAGPDVAFLKLNEPLQPGHTIEIASDFEVQIPSGKISRLGHIDQSYQITQWYPKPAVYDHKGWHPMPYLTQGEFYSEFGSFDVYITLPKNYVVASTGDLQTQSELTWLDSLDEQTRRGERKGQSKFPPSDSETKTLHYFQEKIHDFAWFADKRFAVLKDEVQLPHSGRTVTTWSMYTRHEDYLWESAPQYLADGIYYYSLWLGDYPYNQVTAVDGTISAGGGMEYPNVTVIGQSGSPVLLENVIVHEVGHNWFYGILGSNERKHPWMDEGMNSFYENRYFETKYPNMPLSEMMPFGGLSGLLDLDEFERKYYQELMYLFSHRQHEDQPIDLHSAEYTSLNYGAIVYSKTALIFEHLMNYLGEEDFDRLMKEYYETWKFKHPYPEDFEKIMRNGTDKDLSWFFDTLIPTTQPIDYKISGIRKIKTEGAVTGYEIKVKNNRKTAAPFSLSTMENDSILSTFWFDGHNKSKWITLNPVVAERIRIDGKHDMLERNRKNNTIRTSGLFRKTEKIQFNFLGAPENPYRTQIFYSPIIGYNHYDKVMPGIIFYNSLIPRKKFEYILAPMIGTGSGELTGLMQLNYRIMPQRSFIREVNIRFDAKRFSFYNQDPLFYNQDPYNLMFTKATPSLFIKFRNKLTSHHRFYLELRQKNINEEFIAPLFIDDVEFVEENKATLFNEAEFTWINDFVLAPSEMNVELEGGPDYIKAFGEYKLNIPYFKGKKAFDVRVFGGSFLSGNNVSPWYGFSFSGEPDYQYDHTLLGRSEGSGLLSRQRFDKDGAFKHITDQMPSTNWISGVNLMASIPKVPLAAYLDAGIAGYENSTAQAWDAGIAVVVIKNIFEVYFPVAQSSEMQTEYHQNIRFKLNFDLLNPFETLRKLDI